MPNLEIQHVVIALKPQHQRLRRLERRRARSIGSAGASPVRDLKSAVGSFGDASDRNKIASSIRRLGVDGCPVRNAGDPYPLGRRTSLPKSTGCKTENDAKRTDGAERALHSNSELTLTFFTDQAKTEVKMFVVFQEMLAQRDSRQPGPIVVK